MDMNTVVASRDGIIYTEVDGEVVLMHVEQGIYFSLNDVGACIWKQMGSQVKIADLCAVVEKEFDVSHRTTCRSDVLSLLDQLGAEGLVDTVD